MHGEYFSFFVLTSLTLNLIPTTVVFVVVDIVIVVLVAVVVVLSILELDTGPQLDSPLMQSMQVLFNNIQF